MHLNSIALALLSWFKKKDIIALIYKHKTWPHHETSKVIMYMFIYPLLYCPFFIKSASSGSHVENSNMR